LRELDAGRLEVLREVRGGRHQAPAKRIRRHVRRTSLIGLEYIIPATAFIGVLLFFWGISSMLGGGSPESLGARMQRYAGGTEKASTEVKKHRRKGRRD